MTSIDKCLIWPDPNATIDSPDRGEIWIVESARAGGKYEIDVPSGNLVKTLDGGARARLTTWLVDQRLLGNPCPKITREIVEYAKVKRPLLPHERVARLLRFIAEQMETIASVTHVQRGDNDNVAYAWSESTDWGELHTLISYLSSTKLLDAHYDARYPRFEVRVTIEGYRKIAEQEVYVATTQAFVAMWFDDSMNDAFERGIKPAIELVGYKPLRIDQKLDVNKIDDEIIAEIRRSRFLVADFTHGDEGARGGVYFEAGFAHGLGIPVIFTCRKDMVGKLHFDTRQYAHIVWQNPEELRDGLRNRILARIGEGPGDGFAG